MVPYVSHLLVAWFWTATRVLGCSGGSSQAEAYLYSNFWCCSLVGGFASHTVCCHSAANAHLCTGRLSLAGCPNMTWAGEWPSARGLFLHCTRPLDHRSFLCLQCIPCPGGSHVSAHTLSDVALLESEAGSHTGWALYRRQRACPSHPNRVLAPRPVGVCLLRIPRGWPPLNSGKWDPLQQLGELLVVWGYLPRDALL